MAQDYSPLPAQLTPEETEHMGPIDPNDIPDRAFAFYVEFDIQNSEVVLLYKKAYKYDITGFRDLKDKLDYLAKNLATVIPGWQAPDVSGQLVTPLSIHNEKNCAIILVLGNKNLNFASQHAPFMVKRGYEDEYVGPCRVQSSGQIEDNPNVKVDDCKVAFFVANTYKQHQGGDYNRVPFNIHVDLKIGVPDSKGQTPLLPIIIDPDIGHPGGSKPK